MACWYPCGGCDDPGGDDPDETNCSNCRSSITVDLTSLSLTNNNCNACDTIGGASYVLTKNPFSVNCEYTYSESKCVYTKNGWSDWTLVLTYTASFQTTDYRHRLDIGLADTCLSGGTTLIENGTFARYEDNAPGTCPLTSLPFDSTLLGPDGGTCGTGVTINELCSNWSTAWPSTVSIT